VELFELKNVQSAEVVAALAARAEALLGRPVEVDVTTGALPVPKGPDPLEELIRRGGDIVTVEE
jgi:hypothetical protein